MNLSKALVAAGLLAALALTGCHHKKPAKDTHKEQAVVPVATLYDKGMDALKKKKPATARRYFDQIALREDAGEYKDKAAIATADAYFQEGSIESIGEAVSRYQSFLAFHPTHPQAAYCQFRIGEAWFSEVGTPDRDTSASLHAKESYEAVLENYATSPYAEQAKKKLAQVNDMLAAHEIRIGDWYLKEGHPKGAIARYRGVMEKYPKYWNMPAVYSRLGEALYRDGQDKEAILYFKRIVEEVPGTALAKSAQQRMDRIQKKEHGREAKDKDVFKEPLVPHQKKDKHWWQFWK